MHNEPNDFRRMQRMRRIACTLQACGLWIASVLALCLALLADTHGGAIACSVAAGGFVLAGFICYTRSQ